MSEKQPSILVFGRNGQLARALADTGFASMRFLDRLAVDLTDPAACGAAVRESEAAMIINAAAYTNVDGAQSDADTAFAVNAQSPIAMAEAAAARDIPFVSVSTDYVFDGSGTQPWQPDDPIKPLGVYGASKAEGEAGILAAGGRGAVLRTSWVFSATGKNFVTTMLSLAETRDHLTVVDDQVGGPTEAADLAQACLALGSALADGRAGAGVYHYAGAPDVSWAGFAREIFQQASKSTTVEHILTADYPPRPTARPLNSRLDCTSFTAATGLERADWRLSLSRVLSAIC